jgi:flavin reductase (DIM6/NTAB) family NADH-FMN oxidoreductase RutF
MMDPQMAEAFRQIPYGIYVLTTQRGAELCAMIVSWVSQVSYSPPLLTVALRRNRPALPAIRESGAFSLSLLSRDQKPFVDRLKEPTSPGQLPDLFRQTNEEGPPVIKGACASWECRLFSQTEAGDHILLFGEVLSTMVHPEGEPLTTADYGKTYIGQK